MVGVFSIEEALAMTEHIIVFSSGTRYDYTPECSRCAIVVKARRRGKKIGGPNWTPPEHPPWSRVLAQCLCGEHLGTEMAVSHIFPQPMIQQKAWPLMRATLARAGCG